MTRCHIAELCTEGDLAGVVKRLIAKEHDLPFVHRSTNCPDLQVG
jgi:hypothetical protein